MRVSFFNCATPTDKNAFNRNENSFRVFEGRVLLGNGQGYERSSIQLIILFFSNLKKTSNAPDCWRIVGCRAKMTVTVG